jgi:predicted NAD/FAD-dependent oxidoreductase
MNIAIVGGGIAGLATALTLHAVGMEAGWFMWGRVADGTGRACTLEVTKRSAGTELGRCACELTYACEVINLIMSVSGPSA